MNDEKKEEETEPKSTEKPDDLAEKVEAASLEILQKKKAELEEIEKRVEKKTKELNDAVDGYRVEGRALAGMQKPIETPEELASKARIKEIGMTTGANWAKDL